MPKFAYRRLAALGETGSSTSYGGGYAVSCHKQLTEKLLCQECEQAVGKWEDEAAKQMLQRNGKFPWHERLSPHPNPQEGDVAFSTCLSIEDISRFGLSIFWRASVSRTVKISLGPYAEKLRAYLRGTEALPSGVRLMVAHMTESPCGMPMLDRMFVLPERMKNTESGFTRHSLFLLGVKFDLLTGSLLPHWTSARCFARTGLVHLNELADFKRHHITRFATATPLRAGANHR